MTYFVEKQSIIKKKLKDYPGICIFCKDRVVQAYARGLISGYPDGTFSPRSSVNRVEAVTVLIRLIDSNYRLNVDYS